MPYYFPTRQDFTALYAALRERDRIHAEMAAEAKRRVIGEELAERDAREVGGNRAADEPQEEGLTEERIPPGVSDDDLGRGAPRRDAPRPFEPLLWEEMLALREQRA